MSLELPVVDVPYPGINPTYDVSQYLANGCEPFSAGSVMATIENNHVFWDVRISTGNAENNPNRRLFQGLPTELTPPIGITRPAALGVGFTLIQWHASGWIFLTDATKNLRDGAIMFEARTIRRAA